MSAIPLNPGLQAELERLERFAEAHGQSPASALQDAVKNYLEAQDSFEDDTAAIERGYRDMKAGRTMTLDQFEQHMRLKYGISR